MKQYLERALMAGDIVLSSHHVSPKVAPFTYHDSSQSVRATISLASLIILFW
jgi:hypothetical protein